MCVFPRLCGFFLLLSLGSLCAEQLPEMRPALLGTGPKSLINLIFLARLSSRKTGRMFCHVAVTNQAGGAYTLENRSVGIRFLSEMIYELGRSRHL
jgi:hypothetical protein